MQITINLPEDVVKVFASNGANPERKILEATAAEGYRSGKLSQTQIKRMLGFKVRTEVDAFLREHDVTLNYTIEDLEADRKTLDKILAK